MSSALVQRRSGPTLLVPGEAKPRDQMTVGDFLHSESTGPAMKDSVTAEELAAQRPVLTPV